MKDSAAQAVYHKGWRTTLNGRFYKFKDNASRRGIPFDLTRKDVACIYKDPCHYCGVDMKVFGMDRVDNDKGYAVDNVVPCCSDCNMAKRMMSREDFIGMCARVAQKWGGK